jgi:hypothetical protein
MRNVAVDDWRRFQVKSSWRCKLRRKFPDTRGENRFDVAEGEVVVCCEVIVGSLQTGELWSVARQDRCRARLLTVYRGSECKQTWKPKKGCSGSTEVDEAM